MFKGSLQQCLPAVVGDQFWRCGFQQLPVALHVKGEAGARRYCQEADWDRLSGVMRVLAFLVVMFLVRSHDFHTETVAFELGYHIPENQGSTLMMRVPIIALQAEQGGDGSLVPA